MIDEKRLAEISDIAIGPFVEDVGREGILMLVAEVRRLRVVVETAASENCRVVPMSDVEAEFGKPCGRCSACLARALKA